MMELAHSYRNTGRLLAGWPRRQGACTGGMAAMLTGAVACVLDVLGVRPGRITVLKDVPPGNGSWLVELPCGQRAVLRRYHPGASPEDLGDEHAVLGYLAGAGWAVPHPVSAPVC